MLRLLSVVFVSVALAQELIVDLPDGTIRGSEITYQNKSYYAYRGIPFATPPLGKLRFQPPIPPKPWDGILEANETQNCCMSMWPNALDSEDCLYLNVYTPARKPPIPPKPWDGILEANETQNCCMSMWPNALDSEDCLYLNVYTPARKITEGMPVMFFIYGGAFTMGCTSDVTAGPFYLLDDDVIIVYTNYRLGLYGFLSTQDDVVLGNAGLKDQLLAMKWTKNNIALFGGDPGKITIFGGSAGGISVGAHIVNPKSAGLYRAAICQSGCSLTYINTINQNNPRQAAYDYAKYVDPTISEKNTTAEIRDFLQSLPADVLTSAFAANTRSGISIEVEHEDAYVTNLSFPQLESGNFNQVPLILGTTSSESLSFYGLLGGVPIINTTAVNFDLDVTNVIPSDLILLPDINATHVGTIIKDAYVGSNRSFSENWAAVLELTSDRMFVKSTLKQAEMQSIFTPVYLYQFSFQMINLPPVTGIAGHGAEGAYLFSSPLTPLLAERDVLFSKRIVRLWTNFAKTLNPTPDSMDPLLNLTWTKVSRASIQYLDLDDDLAMKPNRKEKEMAMWNDVYYTYGQRPIIGF